MTDARDINDRGQIAASGVNGRGYYYHALLLTPVPEPCTLVMFAGLGAMGLIAAWRRKRAAYCPFNTIL